ncbi:uncharacterized protein [Amphiura filiformis]|uniref:uncharacterized protein n=1 Tax=Amphiura filiformis TaxID=82378 RepID=UPI003B221FF1
MSRRYARRCMVEGCSNQSENGKFGVYEPGKGVYKLWRTFMGQSTKDFCNKRIHICSGHFKETDFVESQVIQYVTGHRTLKPRLLPTAVPSSIKARKQPFQTYRVRYGRLDPPDIMDMPASTTPMSPSPVTTTPTCTTRSTFVSTTADTVQRVDVCTRRKGVAPAHEVLSTNNPTIEAKYRMPGNQIRIQAPPSKITKNILQPFECRCCLRWWPDFERYRRHIRRRSKWKGIISKVCKGITLCRGLSIVSGNWIQQTKELSLAYECDNCKKRLLTLSAFDDHKCISDTQSVRKCKNVGRRCMVGGCSNRSEDGEFSVFEAPKGVYKLWRTFMDQSVKDFHNKHIHICSGHFKETDFIESQVIQYVTGTRTYPPRLLPTAVPSSIKATKQTFQTHRARYGPSDTQSGPTQQARVIQPNYCSCCNMRFITASDVVRHLKEQHSLLRWTCNKCGMDFATNDKLFEHKAIMHSYVDAVRHVMSRKATFAAQMDVQ